jgi:tetratricopeptide (TPR) repeat protein
LQQFRPGWPLKHVIGRRQQHSNRAHPVICPGMSHPGLKAWPGMQEAFGAVHTGDIESAREAEMRLAELRDIAQERGDDNMVVYIETDRLVLEGRIAFAEGEEDKAVNLVRSAAELETSVEKHPVTPGALQPPNEALAYLLLDLNRPDEALIAFEASDNLWPGRLNTLMGAALAAKMKGDIPMARKYFARLLNGAGPIDIEPIGDAY